MGRKKNVDKKEIFELEDASKTSITGDVTVDTPKNKEEVKSSKTKSKSAKEKKKIKHGKKYNRAVTQVDKNKFYPVAEAIEVCKKVSTSRFDGSLELHLNLGIDVKSEQKVRASTTLPHGTGRKVIVMAFVSADKDKSSREAGADFIGSDETIEDIFKGLAPVNFDKTVATPDFMPKLAKVAKILGPRGLMPSPKNGTVTLEPEKAIKELKKGKLEIKNEVDAPIIHLGLGKLSFPTQNLVENFIEVIRVVKDAKPPKTSGDFLISAILSPTMGPSVKVDLTPFK